MLTGLSAFVWRNGGQTDPIGYGDGMNIYAYADNDPVNSTDPSGLQEMQPDGPDIHVIGYPYYTDIPPLAGVANPFDDNWNAVGQALSRVFGRRRRILSFWVSGSGKS